MAEALSVRSRTRWPAWYRRIYPYFYVGPALLVTIVLVAAPIIHLVQASLRDWELGDPVTSARFVGLDNFERAVTGPVSLAHSLRLTLIYTFSALAIELVLGLAIALLLERLERALPFLMSVLLVPMVLMPAMVAMVWRLYFSYEGLVNWVMSTFTPIEPINWFSTEHALKAVILTDVWQWTPFFALLLIAGLQNVSRELTEAAEVDGASAWQVIGRIKLPLLAPLIIIASTLRVMELIRQFDLAFIMFGGGPGSATEIMPLAVFRTTVQRLESGVGSALSIFLILIVMAVAWVFIRLMKRYRTEI